MRKGVQFFGGGGWFKLGRLCSLQAGHENWEALARWGGGCNQMMHNQPAALCAAAQTHAKFRYALSFAAAFYHPCRNRSLLSVQSH
jgi:hypothetical protein